MYVQEPRLQQMDTYCTESYVCSYTLSSMSGCLKDLRRRRQMCKSLGFVMMILTCVSLRRQQTVQGVSTNAKCTLVCSGGIVNETEICGKEWTVGVNI